MAGETIGTFAVDYPYRGGGARANAAMIDEMALAYLKSGGKPYDQIVAERMAREEEQRRRAEIEAQQARAAFERQRLLSGDQFRNQRQLASDAFMYQRLGAHDDQGLAETNFAQQLNAQYGLKRKDAAEQLRQSRTQGGWTIPEHLKGVSDELDQAEAAAVQKFHRGDIDKGMFNQILEKVDEGRLRLIPTVPPPNYNPSGGQGQLIPVPGGGHVYQYNDGKGMRAMAVPAGAGGRQGGKPVDDASLWEKAYRIAEANLEVQDPITGKTRTATPEEYDQRARAIYSRLRGQSQQSVGGGGGAAAPQMPLLWDEREGVHNPEEEAAEQMNPGQAMNRFGMQMQQSAMMPQGAQSPMSPVPQGMAPQMQAADPQLQQGGQQSVGMNPAMFKAAIDSVRRQYPDVAVAIEQTAADPVGRQAGLQMLSLAARFNGMAPPEGTPERVAFTKAASDLAQARERIRMQQKQQRRSGEEWREPGGLNGSL